MPIHYQQDSEHVVLITIDRPEARNSCDMEHFKALREAWERLEVLMAPALPRGSIFQMVSPWTARVTCSWPIQQITHCGRSRQEA